MRKLLAGLSGTSAESEGSAAPPSAEALPPREPPEPTIPAIEMAGALARTRDFLAARRRLVSGIGWESLARLPEWTGERPPAPSGTLARTSWSGVLDKAPRPSAAAFEVPAEAKSLLDFVEARKSLYRFSPGGEGMSLDSLLAAPRPTEGVVEAASTAGSAILKRLGSVWGRGAGEKPVSPQRIGRVVMRHPAPPTPRVELSLPWRETDEAVEESVSPVVSEARRGEAVAKAAAEAPESALGKVLAPVTKAVSTGRATIRRLLRNVTPTERVEESHAPVVRRAPAAGEVEPLEAPAMPLVREIVGEAEAPERAAETVASGRVEPSIGASAARFSRTLAEEARRIVPDLGSRFPLAGGAFVEKAAAEAERIVKAPASETSKLLRTLAARSVEARASVTAGKPVRAAASPLGGPAAGAPGAPKQTVRKTPGPTVQRFALPLPEVVRSPEKALMALAGAAGYGSEAESLAKAASGGGAGIVSWAAQIAERHAPAELTRAASMLRGLSIPTSVGALEERAAGALEEAPSAIAGAMGISLPEGIAEHPLESIERAVPGAVSAAERYLSQPLQQIAREPGALGVAVQHPLAAVQRAVGLPEMPLAIPSAAREAAGGAIGGAAEEVEHAASSLLPSGEVSEAESAVTRAMGVAEEGLTKLPDMDELTDEIYRRLVQRLKMEREIRGL